MSITANRIARWAIAALLISAIAPVSVQAQSRRVCTDTDGDYEPASETRRTVELRDFNIAVAVPENYRTMRLQDGSVLIVHPDDFQWLQCLVQGGTGAHGYYSERISQVAPDPSMSLRDQAMFAVGYSVNPDGSREPGAVEVIPYQNNGLEGYIVTSVSGYSVMFLGTAPGSDQLLQVSAGCDCEVEMDALTDLLSQIRPLN